MATPNRSGHDDAVVDLTLSTQQAGEGHTSQNRDTGAVIYTIDSSDSEPDHRMQNSQHRLRNGRNTRNNVDTTIDLTEVDDSRLSPYPNYPPVQELDDIIEVIPPPQPPLNTMDTRPLRRSSRQRRLVMASTPRRNQSRQRETRRGSTNNRNSLVDRLDRIRSMTREANEGFSHYPWFPRSGTLMPHFLQSFVSGVGLFANHGEYLDHADEYDDEGIWGNESGDEDFGFWGAPLGNHHPSLHGHHFMANRPRRNLPNGMYATEEDINNGNIAQLIEEMEQARRRPTRPYQPNPLKLTKRQESLSNNPQYTRKVPPVNSGEPPDAKADPTSLSKIPRLVCASCTEQLLASAPVWAPKCGHAASTLTSVYMLFGNIYSPDA
ncbi:hypothetical protein H4219_000025 [Mycoemilia scoparia]|uniref:Uncharacterized protein n=1 Tax=Mycoemilia scoparia TaxID=417184 RepID=A0A9W8DTD9_9FUNG|nr:hypothetical protein H4219_000025 [Mycoemilia scoparia]